MLDAWTIIYFSFFILTFLIFSLGFSLGSLPQNCKPHWIVAETPCFSRPCAALCGVITSPHPGHKLHGGYSGNFGGEEKEKITDEMSLRIGMLWWGKKMRI